MGDRPDEKGVYLLVTEVLSLGRGIGILFVYVFLGCLGRWAKILDRDTDKGISNLIFYFTMPALTIASMNLPMGASRLHEGFLILAGALLLVGLSYFLTVLISRLWKVDGARGDAFCFGSLFGNVTYLGFPVCYLLFGKLGIFYAALFSLGHNLLFWTMGLWLIGRRENSRLSWREILNVNVLSIILGFILAVAHVRIPPVILQPLDSLGEPTIPLALLLIGSMMAEGELKTLATDKLVYLATAVKLLALPALTLLLLHFLPVLSLRGRTVFLLEMAMPTAALAPTVARKYNGAYSFLSQVVIVSTLASLLVLPLFSWLATY